MVAENFDTRLAIDNSLLAIGYSPQLLSDPQLL